MQPRPVLKPLTEADYATVAQLGDTIWRAHYSKLISMGQIEYMLAGRYSPERLSAYVNAKDRWLHILSLDNQPVGYCSYSLTDSPGELKLEQLYLLPALHGKGLGRFMLEYVEAEARRLGCTSIMLTVNRGNATSIAVYDRAGYTVRESAVFDIGNGYVMDDYIMVKQLT